MRRLTRPTIDDAAALAAVANDDGLISYPHLLGALPQIVAAYGAYEVAAGNAQALTAIALTEQQVRHLKAYYKKTPIPLRYIDTMRAEHGHLTCPMCGGPTCGTLDHVLPKEDFTEFAVYSRNLVPACKCNVNRNRATVGPNPGERVLHPYYDDCLNERLLVCHMEELGPLPRISLVINVPAAHPAYSAIRFHLDAVVKKMPLLKYLERTWRKLCARPSTVIRYLRHPVADIPALRNLLEQERHDLDELHDSMNNWNSIFVNGLLEHDVLQWLLDALHAPGRPPDGRLIPP